jgi:hypothetical protein
MDKTVMIETQAREISNNDLKVAFKLAHSEVRQTVSKFFYTVTNKASTIFKPLLLFANRL